MDVWTGYELISFEKFVVAFIKKRRAKR